MNKKNQNIIQIAKAVALGIVISVGVGYASASFSNPTATPPGGNVDAPVNVGANLQSKAGSLWADFLGANGNAIVNGTLQVKANNAVIPLNAVFTSGTTDGTTGNGIGTWKAPAAASITLSDSMSARSPAADNLTPTKILGPATTWKACFLTKVWHHEGYDGDSRKSCEIGLAPSEIAGTSYNNWVLTAGSVGANDYALCSAQCIK